MTSFVCFYMFIVEYITNNPEPSVSSRPQWSESGTEWRDLKTFVYTLVIRAFALGTGKYAIAKTDRM